MFSKHLYVYFHLKDKRNAQKPYLYYCFAILGTCSSMHMKCISVEEQTKASTKCIMSDFIEIALGINALQTHYSDNIINEDPN